MKLLVLASLLAAATAAAIFDQDWESFKQEHGKQYEDVASEQKRYSIWKDNLALIEDHNKEADQHGYELGMNEYGDLTSEEFAAMMNTYVMEPPTNSTNTFKRTDMALAENVDWREQGAVTEVKNQGQCGSCWSFSATGSLEGQHFLKGGRELVSLSEQNLMDCSTKYGNHACKGGAMRNAFRYIIANDGIDTEESYPYQAHTELFCRFKAADVGATMTSFKEIERGAVEALTEACQTVGPISVAMDAGRPTFHLYKRGVYSDSTCSSTKLNHGVLVVGFGVYEEETPYFLVKNSWGRTWGQEGYFMIKRDYSNMCGLATQASYPVV